MTDRLPAFILAAAGASLLPLPDREALGAPPAPANPRAFSRHLRVDIVWDRQATANCETEIQRSPTPQGPFRAISSDVRKIPVYSDFIGEAGKTYYYRMRALARDGRGETTKPSPWSPVVRGVSRRSDREQLLTEIQEASVRYFYDYGHPVSGLAREGSHRKPDTCAIGTTGMGLFNLGVAVERGFITRQQGTARALKVLRFLAGTADRYHGAFPHWMNGTTGKTIPFSRDDDDADLVETAFLMEGVLFLREYFSRADAREAEVRRLADRLWREVEWDWFAKEEGSRAFLLWHWSPKQGWAKHHVIQGFNECHITYVLGLASPTHPIPMKCYRTGWEHAGFARKREAFGVPIELHRGYGPPMFFFHYSYLGLDPRAVSYSGKTCYDHFRDLCRVQVLYAESRKGRFKGYGPMWGLTASMGPDGYMAHAPGPRDDGTIAPTAALSSMPYLPEESFSCLKVMYEQHGKRLWDEFGFRDAFNLSRDWVAKGLLGLDAGPIAPMIENHRTGLCWRTFMKAREIQAAVKSIRDSR